jgi:excisionase family DNA binding protein
MTHKKLLLKPAEVCELLGMSKSKIQRMIANGQLPVIRVGGNVRIPMDQLRAWVREMSNTK